MILIGLLIVLSRGGDDNVGERGGRCAVNFTACERFGSTAEVNLGDRSGFKVSILLCFAPLIVKELRFCGHPLCFETRDSFSSIADVLHTIGTYYFTVV